MIDKPTKLAIRIAALYLVLAGVWILTSDRVVSTLMPRGDLITHFQTFKGLAFVGVTSVLLFMVILRPLRAMEAEIKRRSGAEESLQDNQRQRDALLTAIPDMLFVMSRDGKFLEYHGPKDATLVPPAQFVGKNIRDVLPENIAKTMLEKIGEAVSKGTAANYAYPLEVRGTKKFFEARFSRCGQDSVLILSRDCTDSNSIERKLENSLAQLQAALESTADGIVVVDTDRKVANFNQKFTHMWGVPETVMESNDEKEILAFVMDQLTKPEAFLAKVKSIYAHPETTSFDLLHLKDNRVFERYSQPWRVRDEILGRVWSFRDMTARKTMEEQLRQSQKMEGIGRLAGGVAHDFNNILGVIQMQAELLRMEGNLDDTQLSCISEIEQAAERATNLTRQMLLFSRRKAMQPRDMDLNGIITGMTKMLQRILGDDIRVNISCWQEPLYVHIDPGMVDQLLLNLCVNSRDAMPKGGRIIVETSRVHSDEIHSLRNPATQPGEYACLAVMDTGSGIAPEHLPHIFEPFFTTKDVGKGTGIGLATVFGIVQQHNGWIDVTSTQGIGTTFRIYLPLLPAAEIEMAEHLPATTNSRGSETLLLVEDDPSLRILVRSILTRLGYQLLEAPTAMEALPVWEAHRGSIHLLLTDLVMPDGMSGIELGQRLTKEDQNLKVIYMSGYSPEIAASNMPLKEGFNFLSKPFRAQELASVIRTQLDVQGTAD